MRNAGLPSQGTQDAPQLITIPAASGSSVGNLYASSGVPGRATRDLYRIFPEDELQVRRLSLVEGVALLREKVAALVENVTPAGVTTGIGDTTSDGCTRNLAVGQGERRQVPPGTQTEHAMLCKEERQFFELRILTEASRIAVVYWLAKSFEWDSIFQAARDLSRDLTVVDDPSSKIAVAYSQRIRALVESLAVSIVRDATYLPKPLHARRHRELQDAETTLPCGQQAQVSGRNSLEARYASSPAPGVWISVETTLQYTMTHAELASGRLRNEGLEPLFSLLHPNLARVHELFIQGGRMASLQDRVTGGPLMTVLARYRGNYSEGHVRHIAGRVLQVLAYLHPRGVAHGNVRLEGIVCASKTLSGELKMPAPLHLVGAAGAQPTIQTIWGNAPETLGGGAPTAASDFWSLGALLYFLLTGCVPFPAESVEEMTGDICNAEMKVRWPNSLWKRVSADAQSLCETLLDFSSEARSRLRAEKLLTTHPWFQLSAAQLGAKPLRIEDRPMSQSLTPKRKIASSIKKGLGLSPRAQP